MTYNAGDRVRIVNLSKLKKCKNVNVDGLMGKWAGEVMTIKEVIGENGSVKYLMHEDEGEFHNGSFMGSPISGWVWFDEMIEEKICVRNTINEEELIDFLC